MQLLRARRSGRRDDAAADLLTTAVIHPLREDATLVLLERSGDASTLRRRTSKGLVPMARRHRHGGSFAAGAAFSVLVYALLSRVTTGAFASGLP